jgi:serine---pyruvate transaminase
MIKKNYLLSPGPTPIHEDVLLAAAEPMIHHRTSKFSKIFEETSHLLKEVFCTSQPVFMLASSGTGAMEAAVINTLSPGDKALVLNGGKFGERWGNICKAYSLDVKEIVIEWGENFTGEALEEALKANPGVKAVFCALSETSTGSLYDVRRYGEIVSRTDAILVVDAVSGLVATPCPMDEWKIDVLVSCSQKALMTPPGLAYIALSQKAWKMNESSKLPKFYFDLKKFKKNLESKTTPWTPAVSLVIQQKKALDMIKSIGLSNLHKHHQNLADAVRAGVKALGLELFSQCPGNACTAVKVPTGVEGTKLVKLMQEKYGTYIAGGQDPYKGKIFRIAHLGYMGGFEMIIALSALEMALSELGFPVSEGAATGAAQKILKESWN